jgi:hypothetical protein
MGRGPFRGVIRGGQEGYELGKVGKGEPMAGEEEEEERGWRFGVRGDRWERGRRPKVDLGSTMPKRRGPYAVSGPRCGVVQGAVGRRNMMGSTDITVEAIRVKGSAGLEQQLSRGASEPNGGGREGGRAENGEAGKGGTAERFVRETRAG